MTSAPLSDDETQPTIEFQGVIRVEASAVRGVIIVYPNGDVDWRTDGDAASRAIKTWCRRHGSKDAIRYAQIDWDERIAPKAIRKAES